MRSKNFFPIKHRKRIFQGQLFKEIKSAYLKVQNKRNLGKKDTHKDGMTRKALIDLLHPLFMLTKARIIVSSIEEDAAEFWREVMDHHAKKYFAFNDTYSFSKFYMTLNNNQIDKNKFKTYLLTNTKNSEDESIMDIHLPDQKEADLSELIQNYGQVDDDDNEASQKTSPLQDLLHNGVLKNLVFHVDNEHKNYSFQDCIKDMRIHYWMNLWRLHVNNLNIPFKDQDNPTDWAKTKVKNISFKKFNEEIMMPQLKEIEAIHEVRKYREGKDWQKTSLKKDEILTNLLSSPKLTNKQKNTIDKLHLLYDNMQKVEIDENTFKEKDDTRLKRILTYLNQFGFNIQDTNDLKKKMFGEKDTNNKIVVEPFFSFELENGVEVTIRYYYTKQSKIALRHDVKKFIIVPKRFDSNEKKNEIKLKGVEQISLDQKINDNSTKTKKVNAYLHAAVLHLSHNTNHGHYTAYSIYPKDGEWYYYDDQNETKKPITEKAKKKELFNEIEEKGYVLVYKLEKPSAEEKNQKI